MEGDRLGRAHGAARKQSVQYTTQDDKETTEESNEV